jgi:hypothetical protein
MLKKNAGTARKGSIRGSAGPVGKEGSEIGGGGGGGGGDRRGGRLGGRESIDGGKEGLMFGRTGGGVSLERDLTVESYGGGGRMRLSAPGTAGGRGDERDLARRAYMSGSKESGKGNANIEVFCNPGSSVFEKVGAKAQSFLKEDDFKRLGKPSTVPPDDNTTVTLETSLKEFNDRLNMLEKKLTDLELPKAAKPRDKTSPMGTGMVSGLEGIKRPSPSNTNLVKYETVSQQNRSQKSLASPTKTPEDNGFFLKTKNLSK